MTMPSIQSTLAADAEPLPRLDVHEGESLKHAVLRALRSDIIDGTLPPGTKLSEGRLAQSYGVSRMPVREAFKELEGANFVYIEKKRGTFVRGLTEREIVDLYEVREPLEGMAARLCAQRASAELVHRIDHTVDTMDQHVAAENNAGYIEADEEFHLLIFEGASNARLEEHYGLLVHQIQRNLLSSIVTKRDGRMRRSYEEHRAIAQAIRVRDGDKAEESMRHHVRRGRWELAEAMNARASRA